MSKYQNIKKEIEKHLYMILNLAGVKESVADKVVSVGVKRIMDDVVREAFERFMEETKEVKAYWVISKDKPKADGWNECLERIKKKQQKWLKDNLN